MKFQHKFSIGDKVEPANLKTGDGWGRIIKLGPDYIKHGGWDEHISEGEALVKWYNDGGGQFPLVIVVKLDQYQKTN